MPSEEFYERKIADLSVRVDTLYNALDWIRMAASLHYLGGAFEPDHMRGIANLAIDALEGQKVIDPLPDNEDLRESAAKWWQENKDLFEGV